MPTFTRTIGIGLDIRQGFGRKVLNGITRYALQRHWHLHYLAIEITGNSLKNWETSGVDGLIIQGVRLENEDFPSQPCPFPVVNISGNRVDGIPTVTADNHALGRIVADHFLTLPLSHFAYFGFYNSRVSHERGEGFSEGLREVGHDCEIFHFGMEGIAAAVKCLQSLPTPAGVLVWCDADACSILRGCTAVGFDVRQRIAVVGIDNDIFLCEQCQPALTSVDQHAEQIGSEAAAVLEDLMEGGDSPVEPIYPIPAGIVARESSRLDAINPQLAHAMSIIREHATRMNGVGDLLRHVPIGRRSLERLFHEGLGRTPLDEIRRVRMAEAKRLLADTKYAIEDVARRSGFGDASQLGIAIRAATGLTPTQFRRQHKQRSNART